MRLNRAYCYAITVILLWSTVASAFKITLRYLNVLQMLFYSSITSFIVFSVAIVAFNKVDMLRLYSLRDYMYSALLGFLNPLLYYTVLFKAYSLLPAQIAQSLNYTWPIAIALLSTIILSQRVGLKEIAALLVSFIGVVVVISGARAIEYTAFKYSGVFYALCSAFIWAFYWTLNVRDKRDEILKLFLNFLFGTIYIYAIILLNSIPLAVPFEGLAGAIYIGLFEMGVTFLLWLKALTLSKKTAYISNLIYVVPFISLLFIRLTMGETISSSTIIGLTLIVSGIIVHKRIGK